MIVFVFLLNAPVSFICCLTIHHRPSDCLLSTSLFLGTHHPAAAVRYFSTKASKT